MGKGLGTAVPFLPTLCLIISSRCRRPASLCPRGLNKPSFTYQLPGTGASAELSLVPSAEFKAMFLRLHVHKKLKKLKKPPRIQGSCRHQKVSM